MFGLNTLIRRKIDALNATKAARRQAEIESRFLIREEGGKIYILCNGTAVIVLKSAETTGTVVEQLRKMRATAVEFASHKNVEPWQN